MSRSGKLLIKIIATVLLVFGVYKWFYPTYSWHQKMTIEVEAGGKIYSASNVIAMKVISEPRILPDAGSVDLSMKGEAVVLEFPGPKYLFALLRYKNRSLGPFYARDVFAANLGAGVFSGPGDYWAKATSRQRGKHTVPAGLYPLLVTFTDINDPASVKKVNPNNLAASFGAGYSLKSIMLEITDEAVTTGVVENFGFMKMLIIQSTLSGLETYDKQFSDPIYYLTNKAFKQGIK